jgi:hypothetical protein
MGFRREMHTHLAVPPERQTRERWKLLTKSHKRRVRIAFVLCLLRRTACLVLTAMPYHWRTRAARIRVRY